MQYLNIKKLGLAFGLTGALLYLGCMIVMATVGREGTIKFFNSLLHGLDTSEMIRMDVPLWEAGMGSGANFHYCLVAGACVAGFYNVSLQKTKD